MHCVERLCSYAPATGMLSQLLAAHRDPAGQRGDPAAARPAGRPVGSLLGVRQRRRRVRARADRTSSSWRGLPDEPRRREIDAVRLHPGRRAATSTSGCCFDPLSGGLRAADHRRRLPDPRLRRRLHGRTTRAGGAFFGYFNLFVAAMLLLVLGNNYVMLYLGWEGVGLASYLLISFWYTRPSAATAGKKAFIMNRVGDAGLAIAIFLMFADARHGQLQRRLRRRRHSCRSGVTLALGLLLLLGACGKSGQFPLQAWLPDAMEGPTPVSALIHAATMVTAGVYLIARSNPIFDANADRAGGRGRGRRAHPADRLHHRLRQGRHQAGARLVDGLPDRLHVPRRRARRRRVRAGHHPPARARLLQGRPVPRRRLGHARHERPGRHPPLRRAVEVHEDHLGHVRRWAGSPSSASRRCPASSPRTRSSRPRSTGPAGPAGCSAAPRCSAPGSPRST